MITVAPFGARLLPRSRSTAASWPFWTLTVAPLTVVVAYFALFAVRPGLFALWVQGETGVVELATAAAFAVAAAAAARLAVAPQLSRIHRFAFWVFSLAALFVSLEEISYGQHLLGWMSPDFFRLSNAQGETNLHNLFGSKPGKRLSQLADLGSWAVLVVLPVWVRQRGRRTSTSLIPGLELVPLTLLARLVASLKGVPGLAPDLNELREMLWGWMALGYIGLMQEQFRSIGGRFDRRLAGRSPADSAVAPRVLPGDDDTLGEQPARVG